MSTTLNQQLMQQVAELNKSVALLNQVEREKEEKEKTPTPAQIMKQLSSAVPSGYCVTQVSWEDAQRGVVAPGFLSCYGPNITDVRLVGKEGELFYTVRPQNYNEKLGKVKADDVALIPDSGDPQTLGDYLKTAGLFSSELDNEVSIRFQTTFLPEESQFVPEMYSYATNDEKDPKNVILLCTTQGTTQTCDGEGRKKLFHKSRWLRATATSHAVGKAQVETEEEREEAEAEGLATSSVIGIRSMESRFNVLMTVQIPRCQKPVTRSGLQLGKKPSPDFKICGGVVHSGVGALAAGASVDDSLGMSTAQAAGLFSGHYCGKGRSYAKGGGSATKNKYESAISLRKAKKMERLERRREAGKSSAARVSLGDRGESEQREFTGPHKRHPKEHMTITVVIYNVVEGGVPSEEDVRAAVEDLERLYESCSATGLLADKQFKFVRKANPHVFPVAVQE